MAGRDRMPRHLLYDNMRVFHGGPHERGLMPPLIHPIEEELAAGDDKIRRLLADNRLLVDENIAMKREIDAAREELHALGQAIPNICAQKEAKARELIQMGLKLETELHAIEPLKAEVLELKGEAKRSDGLRQEMVMKVQSMSRDLKRVQGENKQIPNLGKEIEGLHQELVRVRAGYEYEQKAHAEQIEQRQATEKKLVSMAREIEKLRARGPSSGAYGADMSYPSSFGDGYGAGSWGSYETHGFPR